MSVKSVYTFVETNLLYNNISLFYIEMYFILEWFIFLTHFNEHRSYKYIQIYVLFEKINTKIICWFKERRYFENVLGILVDAFSNWFSLYKIKRHNWINSKIFWQTHDMFQFISFGVMTIINEYIALFQFPINPHLLLSDNGSRDFVFILISTIY